MKFDWGSLATAWLDAAERAIEKTAASAPGDVFYALSFHAGYAEAEGRIDPPLLGLNSEAALAAMHPRAKPPFLFSSVRWGPANWKWPDLLTEPRITAAYERLTKHAMSSTPRHWDRVSTRHDLMIFSVANTLAGRARKREGAFATLPMAADFIVYVHEDALGLTAVRETVAARTFAKLFPEYAVEQRAKRQLAAQAPEDRARVLVGCFRPHPGPITWEDAEVELVALGARAVPALLEALTDPQIGWMAAMTLFRIGAPGAESAVPALLDAARTGSGSVQMWSATALGALGRHHELTGLLDQAETRSAAIDGLTAARPDTYPHLEAALARRDESITALVTEALRPGRAAFPKRPHAFAAIAAATRSSFAVIRMDAASALGDSDLGEANRKRAVPILTGLLDDADAEVRRLALLALGWTGRHARGALPRIRAMASDPVEKVRLFVDGVVRDIEG